MVHPLRLPVYIFSYILLHGVLCLKDYGSDAEITFKSFTEALHKSKGIIFLTYSHVTVSPHPAE